MSGNKRRLLGDPEKRAGMLTSETLSDKVFDHILSNSALFLGDKNPNAAQHLLALMDSMNKLAHEVAKEAMANRVALSALPVFGNKIEADPNNDSGHQAYEMRYRIIEQYGDNPPVKDDLYSYDEAVDIYGASFVQRYWGELGENCPSCVTTAAERQLWFSVVRYPVDELTASASIENNSSLDDKALLNSITSGPGFK